MDSHHGRIPLIMSDMRAVLLLAAASAACAQPSLPEILARVSEEAEVLAQMAPQAIAEETLEQRALKAAARFRPRVGAAAIKPVATRIATREIVSEYSLGAFKTRPEVLHEFRQVTAIDGREVKSKDSARRSLALGIRSEDDRIRRQMLEDFAKHGLSGTVTDVGTLLLRFRKRRLANYQFTLGAPTRIGADPALSVHYRQIAGDDPLTIFAGHNTVHIPLAGAIVVRASDGLPLRITLAAERTEQGHSWRQEGSVDYILCHHGFLAPASVVHREFFDGKLLVENVFRYTAFKKFTADAEIKFTEVPEPPK